jgi:hypothetical protein
MKYIISLLLIGVGALFIAKTDGVVGITGRIGWAERNLGATGTYTLYKLLGLLFIILGFMLITGILERMTVGVVGGFLGNVNQGQ